MNNALNKPLSMVYNTMNPIKATPINDYIVRNAQKVLTEAVKDKEFCDQLADCILRGDYDSMILLSPVPYKVAQKQIDERRRIILKGGLI